MRFCISISSSFRKTFSVAGSTSGPSFSTETSCRIEKSFPENDKLNFCVKLNHKRHKSSEMPDGVNE